MIIAGDRGAGSGDGSYSYDVPLPDGDYPVEVLDVEERTSSSGNPMIALVLGVKGPEGGVKVRDYRALTEKAMGFFYGMLTGLAPDLLAQIKWAGLKGEDADIDIYALEGAKGRARFRSEEWNGEERPKVASYLPHPTAATALSEVNAAIAESEGAKAEGEPCPF